MLNFVDAFLNRITMYRLVLYVLFAFVGVAMVFGTLGVMPYSPVALMISLVVTPIFCWATNTLLVRTFNAPANVESYSITALILVLIITPPSLANPLAGILFLFWASVLAMASKFIFAIGKKHLFNPSAVAVVITAYALHQYASWWIGTVAMLPFVLIAGCLIVRKIRRWSLVLSAVLTACAIIGISGFIRGVPLSSLMLRTFVDTPLVFFVTIMLTEPLTMPPTRSLQMLYGALVGALFTPIAHWGPVASTPELALVIGNVFSYLVSPKQKLMLKLKEKIPLTATTYDFVFQPDQRLVFRPGQYMEWTLGQKKSDARGNRRYFTLASSPTESDVRIGLKFVEPASTFKQTMLAMKTGDTIVSSQLAGDFVLPRDVRTPLVFIAGGIGITPFRSMVQYLVDRGERRSITLLYSNAEAQDVVYRDVFDRAGSAIGLKAVYLMTNTEGYLTSERIMAEVPDWHTRMFYLSGPHAMVTAFERTLQGMGVSRRHIKTDYFPGFV